MKDMRNLGDVDLHLYLAGALPAGRRLLMGWALLLDAGLRARLKALREENSAYTNREMTRLRQRLFPALPALPSRALPSRNGASAASPEGLRDRLRALFPPGGRSLGYALAGSFAVLALCAAPFLGQRQALGGFGDPGPEYIVKGSALGVSLFVKGDSAYRVQNHSAKVAPADTLQAIPLGTSAQHLVLLGWDARQGLVRIFPAEGGMSRQVSAAEPPPALLLQGLEENRLVCVTANAPFRIAQAEALLRRKPFQPLASAPATHLVQGLYIQVFAIAKRGGGRI